MLDNDFDNEEYTDDFDELDISDSDQIAREIDRIEQDSLEAKHKKEKDYCILHKFDFISSKYFRVFSVTCPKTLICSSLLFSNAFFADSILFINISLRPKL